MSVDIEAIREIHACERAVAKAWQEAWSDGDDLPVDICEGCCAPANHSDGHGVWLCGPCMDSHLKDEAGEECIECGGPSPHHTELCGTEPRSTLNDLGEEVLAIQHVRWPTTTAHIQGLKLAEEAGEACQALAREALGSSKPYDLPGELADVIIVAAGLAARCGIDLDAAVAAKLDRLKPTVVVP